MAQFYGEVRGQRGKGSRLGSKASGMTAIAASWRGAVEVTAYYNTATDTDMVLVSLIPWRGKGTRRALYDGPISGGFC